VCASLFNFCLSVKLILDEEFKFSSSVVVMLYVPVNDFSWIGIGMILL
jgi:hypothetical protein